MVQVLRRVVLVVALTIVVSPAHGRADQQTLAVGGSLASRLDRLFAAYAGGDETILRRSLTRPVDFPYDRNQFDDALKTWRRDWKPARAYFLFDLLTWTSELAPGSMSIVTQSVASFMAARPMDAASAPALD